MNVYIGDRIENLDLNQEFIELDEDVFYYILEIAEDLPTNIDVLSVINPEIDTVISDLWFYELFLEFVPLFWPFAVFWLPSLHDLLQ